MADVKITYWDTIPCSVMVREGRGERINIQLPPIYMKTVDAVAVKQGKVTAEDYAKEFRVEKSEREGDPQVLAQTIVDELVAQHPREWLWELRDKAGIDAAGHAEAEQE